VSLPPASDLSAFSPPFSSSWNKAEAAYKMATTLFPDYIFERMNAIKGYQQFGKTVALLNSIPNHVLIRE
jgi:hypothetical protein